MFDSLPRPIPAAGVQAFLDERERALRRSVLTEQNYRKYQAALGSRRTADVDYLPIRLDIENVSRCNFRCTMCQVSDWHRMKRSRDLSLDEFKAIIDEQYGLVEIKLQGLGEPLIQRGDYFAMIRYARARHIWVRTTTNASLLHLDTNHADLVDSGVNEIQISIDGATPEVFESIRRQSKFEQVTSNCKLINKYAKSFDLEVTKMWTVVQRDNVHQLEALVDIAADLGFTNQVFSLDVSGWGDPEWEAINRDVDVQDQLREDRLAALVELGEQQGVRVAFWVVGHKYSTDSLDTLCPWPFERAYISSDMRVVPCCIIANPDTYQIGPNLNGISFGQVWEGEAFKNFRQMHIDGNIPTACKNCYR